jgi:hypothetical protein
MSKIETRRGKRNLRKKATRKRRKWENKLIICASTTWLGLSTSPLTASLVSSIMRSRRRTTSATVVAAATLSLNLHFAAHIAAMANLQNDK